MQIQLWYNISTIDVVVNSRFSFSAHIIVETSVT